MMLESNTRLCATSWEHDARTSFRNASRTCPSGRPCSHAISWLMPWMAVADAGITTPGSGRTMWDSRRSSWGTIHAMETSRADACAATPNGSSSWAKERRRRIGKPVDSVSKTMMRWFMVVEVVMVVEMVLVEDMGTPARDCMRGCFEFGPSAGVYAVRAGHVNCQDTPWSARPL
jgi:hypothetical protein